MAAFRAAPRAALQTAGRQASTGNTGREGLEAQVGRRLADVERDLILLTLTRCGGNRTWAADMLGLAPLALRDKLLGYNIAVEEEVRRVRRREASLKADRNAADPRLRATYVPPATFLA